MTTLLFSSSKVPTIMTWTLPRDPTLLHWPNTTLESATLGQISSPALKPFANTHEVCLQKNILSISPLPLAKYSQVRYFGRNIWSSGVSLKILQNAVQTRWPCVNKTQQLKVITKSLDCGYNLKLKMGAGRQELIRWFMMHLLNKVAPLVKRARGNKKIFFGPAY